MRLPVAAFLFLASARLAVAQLTVSTDAAVQTVFSGEPAAVTVFVSNAGREPVKDAVSTRIFQLVSAAKMPLGEKQPWKEIEVLAGQTVREKIELTFPPLAEPALYRVECAGAKGGPLGGVTVRACPRMLLQTLTRLSGGQPVGVGDAGGQLAAVLKKSDVPLADLAGEAAADFHGSLALLRSADATPAESARLRALAATLAKRGVAVLWLQPAPAGAERETRSTGRGGTVCELALRAFDRLENSAEAQLRIVESVRYLLTPAHEPSGQPEP